MRQSQNIFRKHSQTGEWCSLLVPLAIIAPLINNKIFSTQDMLLIIQCVFITILSHKLWYAIDASTNLSKHEKSSPAGQTYMSKDKTKNTCMVIVICLCLTVVWLVTGINRSGIITLIGILAYPCFLPLLFSTFPGSFTYGEGCIVMQSVTLFIINTFTKLISTPQYPKEASYVFTAIIQVLLLSEILLIVISTVTKPILKKYPQLFYVGTLIIFGGSLLVLIAVLPTGPVSFVITYITNSNEVGKLIFIWFIPVMVSLLIVKKKQNTTAKASTSARKLFHGLVVIVMLSGLNKDIEFTSFASLMMLIMFVYIECLRTLNIGKISALLNDALSKFTDEKDEGSLILSHIYLLIGVFLPLWIAYDLKSVPKLFLLSGVLSVGIGDSVASIIGSRYGKTKWPYSPRKSVEGTMASIIGQFLFVHFLALTNHLNDYNSNKLLLSITITSLIEAHTTQVDNIVLPFSMYIISYVMG